MTNEPSPRPWRIGENSLGWKSCIEDANGKQIASCWGGDGVNCTEPAQSDAALIVDAVNERDRLSAQLAATVSEALAIRAERDRLRAELADKAQNYEDVIAYHQRTEESLRDIVRRLVPLAETTVENIRALGTARFPFEEQIKSDRLRGDINREVAKADHLLREASAAIGEGAR